MSKIYVRYCFNAEYGPYSIGFDVNAPNPEAAAIKGLTSIGDGVYKWTHADVNGERFARAYLEEKAPTQKTFLERVKAFFSK